MIWLIKTREKAITDGRKDTYTYLRDCMEPADKYIKKIKAGRIKSEIKTNAIHHLYQLMELYVDCKIVSEWLTLKDDEERLDFFLHFTDIDYLKKVCNFTDSYCSQFEYNSFSDEMKNAITSLYDEYISEFKKAFQECVDNFDIQTYPNGLSKIDAISSMLSFYINQGAWTALRIVPTKLCTFDKLTFQGKKQINFDYIINPIMTFDKKLKLEPVIDNQQFYSDSARDCFVYFLTLAKKLYDSDIEIRLDRIEADVEILRRNDNEKTKILEALTQLVNENNQNQKLNYYQSLTQDELIKLFYQIYVVPKNFFDILQTYPFENKIILKNDFKIRYGFQALIITYLSERIDGQNEITLLKVLFHIKAKNPQSEKYVDRLDNFKSFIKKYAK